MTIAIQQPETWTEAESAAIRDLAAQLFERGHVERAADLLRALIVATPKDRTAWHALAGCHDALDETELAESLRALGDYVAELDETGAPS